MLTKEISFNLINAFNTTVNSYTSNINDLFADYRAQTQSVSITNIGNSSLNDGGVSWLIMSQSGSNVYFEFAENNTGINRTTNTIITNLDTLQTINISVTQIAKLITADNNIITVDIDTITVDNG